MRCHFVYSVPKPKGTINRLYRKARYFLQEQGFPVSLIGSRKHVKTESWPIGTPYSITRKLYENFANKMETLLYHLTEPVKIKFKPDDIFIGHPFFPYSPELKGVTEYSIEQELRPRLFALITPLHCNIDIRNNHISKPFLDAVNQLVPKTDLIFAIMGKYWDDQWDASPYAHWRSKIVRLDLAIDTINFPRLKNNFNPPGKRGYLYIGRNDPMKGIDLLSELLSQVGTVPRGWIGEGPDIPSIPKISEPRALTADFMQQLSERFDFFITTGIADPNPTTILESMSWGFPVICTPQSGYYETSYLRNVYHDNVPRSLEVLKEMQYAKEEDLLKMANEARYSVETEFTWEKFVKTIFSKLNI